MKLLDLISEGELKPQGSCRFAPPEIPPAGMVSVSFHSPSFLSSFLSRYFKFQRIF